MRQNKSGSWKMERASITSKLKSRPRSNKYSHSDKESKPAKGSRQRIWVGGYTKGDGTHVAGHYRQATRA